jgi:hypothetical protein
MGRRMVLPFFNLTTWDSLINMGGRSHKLSLLHYLKNLCAGIKKLNRLNFSR